MNDNIITLTREEYDKLLYKAMCWELYRTSIINDTYLSDTERLLFDVPKKPEPVPEPAEEVTENA